MEGGWEALEASGITQTRARELPGYDVYLISVSGKRMGAIAQTLQLNYPSLFWKVAVYSTLVSHRIHGTDLFAYMNGGFLW